MAGHSDALLSFPAMWGSTNGRTVIQTSLSIKYDLISKITNTKKD
jgi:hypothetical protein